MSLHRRIHADTAEGDLIAHHRAACRRSSRLPRSHRGRTDLGIVLAATRVSSAAAFGQLRLLAGLAGAGVVAAFAVRSARHRRRWPGAVRRRHPACRRLHAALGAVRMGEPRPRLGGRGTERSARRSWWGRSRLAALAMVSASPPARMEVVLFLYGFASAARRALAHAGAGLLGLSRGGAVRADAFVRHVHRYCSFTSSVRSRCLPLGCGLGSELLHRLDLQRARPASVVGQLIALRGHRSAPGHTLIGYANRPSGAQLVAYVLTVA